MNLFQNKKLAIILLSSVLIILIALMFIPNLMGNRLQKLPAESTEIIKIRTQSSDTSLDSIENDLDNTDIENIDQELNSIEKEIDASM